MAMYSFPKNKKTVSMGDLRDEAFVLTDVTDYDFTNLFVKAGFTPKVRYTTENDYATIAMVEQGLGVAIIPDLILKNFKRNLCVKKLDEPSFRTMCLAVRSINQASPLTKTFIEFLKDSL